MAFVPSTFQAAIFAAISTSDDNLAINAGPGTGKSTTLEESIGLFRPTQNIAYFAFGKAIVEAMKTRLPALQAEKCTTFHSFGYGVVRRNNPKIRRWNIKKSATYNLWDAAIPDGTPHKGNVCHLGQMLISLAKNTLTNLRSEADLTAMVERYNLDSDGRGNLDLVLATLPTVTRLMHKEFSQGMIDFDDMIYRPISEDYPMPHLDVALVDEFQDLNACQIEITLRLKCRVIMVGDPHQSIYGFRGADIAAWDRAIDALSARILPLSISYRCPTSHIALASIIYPEVGLTARDGALEGTIEEATVDDMIADGTLAAGTMGICRVNAPLIPTAFKLIRQNIPVMVRGKEIGDGLKSLIKKLDAGTIPALLTALDHYRQSEIMRLTERKSPESQLAASNDRIDTLVCIAENCETIPAVVERIEYLFNDSSGIGRVVLSSIHKAKGLEADTVVILSPSKLPLRSPRLADWEVVQERNLQWVAYTRSKNRLVFERESEDVPSA